MTASTDLDDTLANIRARAEAATPGPWEAHEDDTSAFDEWVIWMPDAGCDQALVEHQVDAEFIAHARADVEVLLDLLDQVTTQRDEIQANRDALAHKVAEQRAGIARVREAIDREHARGYADPNSSDAWKRRADNALIAAIMQDDASAPEPSDRAGLSETEARATALEQAAAESLDVAFGSNEDVRDWLNGRARVLRDGEPT